MIITKDYDYCYDYYYNNSHSHSPIRIILTQLSANRQAEQNRTVSPPSDPSHPSSGIPKHIV